MLPLQIALEGFMSYRDATTLSFEGASLWMLSGNNGAGKSSVFDAMRWTLFNRHRGGAQGHDALIHHDRQKLRVAFDLELSSGAFRLIRTLSRTGKSTWQIEKLAENGSEKVPETDMRDGYNRWLSENIGLSDETFCAAFYLAQGRGDAILSARPEDRYEMLAEIVDLSAFARLHETAKTRASELETAFRLQKLRFEQAPDAPETDIAHCAEKLAQLSEKLAQIESRRAHFARLEPWALQWQQIERERQNLETALQSVREILGEAPQIERDFARLLELDGLLPPLRHFLGETRRAALQAAQIEAAKTAFETAKTALEGALETRRAAQNARFEMENARVELEKAHFQALSGLGQIAPQLEQARTLELWQRESNSLENQLAQLPGDLETQIVALEDRIAAARDARLSLGLLTRFEAARTASSEAQRAAQTGARQIQELEFSLPILENEAKERGAALDLSRAAFTSAAETLAAAQSRFHDAQTARNRFESVKGESNCYFCGQKLTPEHAAREEKRLQNAQIEAENARDAARIERENAEAILEISQSNFEAATQAASKSQKTLEKRRDEIERAQKTGREELFRALSALGEIPPRFAARFHEQTATIHAQNASNRRLNPDFLRPIDWEELQELAGQLEKWKTDAQNAETQRKSREKIVARLESVQSQIAPLLGRFDQKTLTDLRAQEAEFQTARDNAQTALEAQKPRAQAAQSEARRAETALEAARLEEARCQREWAALLSAQAEIERGLSLQLAGANDALKTEFEREKTELEAVVAGYETEKTGFEGRDTRARHAILEIERARWLELEKELARLDKTARNVPDAARRAPEELRAEIGALGAQLQAMQRQKSELELEKSELQRRSDEKKRLEVALWEAETRARQHKTLAELLGPQQLQRYLLREAENGIVDEANAVLDRVSSGTLRLELRAEDDEVAGARKGSPKILDVAVFQSGGENPPAAMLPAFLSGSQRFRVAVSLALGIGRFATRGAGHSRLESVIIDEGFGSLDKIGRAEMIEELKSLGEELQRVILVSHQEEFADAFPNRYLIQHDGTASTAQLMVS